MNEEERIAGQDIIDTSPNVDDRARGELKYGPGYVNIAIPDRGHAPSCVAMEFSDAPSFNDFCKDHPGWLVIAIQTKGVGVLVIFNELKSELTLAEMRAASNYAEEKMAEFRMARRRQEDAEAELKAQTERLDIELRKTGRLCIEKHEAFVRDLPGLSKVKNVRKTIADDILKAFYVGGDEAVLTKILEKYVKEGA